MQLRQLEMLRGVVRHASLSGAARELGLTQPAVSMQMKALADEIGRPLFVQRGRRLEPTPAAEALAVYADRILRLVDDARLAARLGLPGSEVVRVAASSTPGALLPARIAAYRTREPATLVRLEVRNSRAVEERVGSGEVDLGIVGGPRTNPELSSQHWCDDQLVLIVAPDHRLGHRRSVRARDLRGETLLVREAGSATRATLEAAFHHEQTALPEHQVLGDTEALKNGVAAGLGVACVSSFSIRSEIEAGHVCVLRVRDLALKRPLSIVTRPGETSPAVARFAGFLRSKSQVPRAARAAQRKQHGSR